MPELNQELTTEQLETEVSPEGAAAEAAESTQRDPGDEADDVESED